MNKDIKSGKSHNGSTLMNEAIDELTARMERVESTLFEVTAILTEYGSIRKLFRKMDSLERRLGQGKKVMTMKEVSEFTGFSMAQLYVLTRTRAIPHSKPNGKTIFFDKSELNEWLLKNKIETVIEFIDEKCYSKNEGF
ncbi:MAG: helix-turn-helix domain-containing protein [Parabacteroides sp.]|jgi:predicted DNA-binding transcriptional regulator AlpA|nr:helix-turn-helix domain-containing protein [Parabacteroides sp.]